jgi:hypothetical protein
MSKIASIRKVIKELRDKELELKNQFETRHNECSGSFEYTYGDARALRESYEGYFVRR